MIFEAGIASTSLAWALIQNDIGQFTTSVSYNRAGLGWSDSHLTPTLDGMVSQLSELLILSRLPPPYLLVGHSFGGLLVRAYAVRYPERVCGVVLIDPVATASWANCSSEDRRRIASGVRLSKRGALLAGFGIVWAALSSLSSGARFLPKIIGRTAAGRGSSVMQRLIGEVCKLPPETWPMIQSHWSNQKSFLAMAAYLECLTASAKKMLGKTVSPEILLHILSASSGTPDEIEERERWAAASSFGRHIRLESCGHWVQVENPNAVIETIRDLVHEIRSVQCVLPGSS